jgi:hypothetical protein
MTGYLEAGPYKADQDGLIGCDPRTLDPSVLKALGHPALPMVKPEKGFIDPRNEWQKVFVNDFLPPLSGFSGRGMRGMSCLLTVSMHLR